MTYLPSSPHWKRKRLWRLLAADVSAIKELLTPLSQFLNKGSRPLCLTCVSYKNFKAD